MKSIKPGRGTSMMNGFVEIVMICIGILWTVVAAQFSGAFALFGILWTCIAIGMTIYNFRNATGKNRYSSFDITDEDEEPDPLNERFGGAGTEKPGGGSRSSKFCPYCGAAVESDFRFCRSCGKKLP